MAGSGGGVLLWVHPGCRAERTGTRAGAFILPRGQKDGCCLFLCSLISDSGLCQKCNGLGVDAASSSNSDHQAQCPGMLWVAGT